MSRFVKRYWFISRNGAIEIKIIIIIIIIIMIIVVVVVVGSTFLHGKLQLCFIDHKRRASTRRARKSIVRVDKLF